jgi:glutathione S-transferase
MAIRLIHQFNVAASTAVSTLGLWRGTSLVKAARQPEKMLRLYDMESCPYCRTVREALTALGLDAEIYPCPRGGKIYRPEAKRIGGKEQFPLLVDPNHAVTMYESMDIVDYLFQTYGGQETPASYRTGILRSLSGAASSLLRLARGTTVRAAERPEQMLELWSFESSPYTRLVRERLTELELAYVLHNIGKEQFADMGPAAMRVKPGPYRPKAGGRREQVLAQFGRVQVPYLEDPNTGVKLYESAKIIDYLERQYAL